MQTVLLGDVTQYINDKVPVNQISLGDYVSTENLLPEKSGLVHAAKLPESGKVTKYQKGDVLVSNIRPYFKKIWFADRDGGASNDVLVFRPTKPSLIPEYLHYVLANDRFFDYSTASSGGSKMPRGDKAQIMKYPTYLPNIETQKNIADILGTLDEKIELNRRTNETLEQMGQALFKHYFIDNPESQAWPKKKLSDFADVVTGKGSTKSLLTEGGQYPLYGANGIIGTSDSYLFDEDQIMTGRVGTLGTVRISSGKLWASDNVLVIKPRKSFGYVYSNVKTFDFQSLNRGSTQPLVTQTDLKNQIILEPPVKLLDNFEPSFINFLKKIQNNDKQNLSLVSLRDSLLPRLISGKIKV